MQKIKIKSDDVLGIVQKIFSDEDVLLSDDTNLQEILNVNYFTFKHKALTTDEKLGEIRQGMSDFDYLKALDRGFCALVLNEVSRLFTKDIDQLTVSATLKYWIQTSKVPILEELIENCNIALSGDRISVDFGEEKRKLIVIFDNVVVTDIQTESACGEMANCEVGITMIILPDVTSYTDYEVRFKDYENPIPLSSFSLACVMTQKALPSLTNSRKTGNLNLGKSYSFVIVFEGHEHKFIDYITRKTMTQEEQDNNEVFQMNIERKDVIYSYDVIVKDHQITVNSDTSNEVHTLSLVTSMKGVSSDEDIEN